MMILKAGLALLCLLSVQAKLPLQHVPEEYVGSDQVPFINTGLLGTVTEEDWDSYTIKDATPPRVWVDSMDACVEGKMMKSINDRPIYAFQGIRYGAPPVGDLRFMPTEEYIYTFDNDTSVEEEETDSDAVCSNNLLVANRLGAMCVQSGMLSHDTAGNEDCLFLNVYTPMDPNKMDAEKPLPVMLWIHGGSFTSGDASMYLPTKLLDHDVILVVIHYRLGAFGFYFLDNEEAPGNAALYDQVESLRWVQRHITSFGGDINRVTAFGESAGSVSVNYMMILPATEGLVHNVIAESGSALEHWAFEEEPMEGSFIIGKKVGCIGPDEEIDPNDAEAMKKLGQCMKHEVSPRDLNHAMGSLVHDDRYSGLMGFRGCSPVMQSEGVIENPILTTTPVELLKKDDSRTINFMIGANKNEGSFVVGVMYAAYLMPHELVNDTVFLREEMIPTVMKAFGVEDDTHGLSISMSNRYLPGIDLGDFEAMAPGMIDLVGVEFLKAGGWETAKMHSYYKKGKTFFYSFEYESDDSMFFWLLGPNYPFPAGVTHSDEMMYIFSFPAKMDGHQITIMNRMTKLWTNFATYGDPTPDEDQSWQTPELALPKWKEFTFDDHNYLLMRDEFTVPKEYPERWTISIDEKTTVAPPITGGGGPSQEEFDDLASERDSYMISMIVFVVCFCLSCGAVFYYANKARR